MSLLTATAMAATWQAAAEARKAVRSPQAADSTGSQQHGRRALAADAAAEEGKVLNIRCWNDEFQSRFKTITPASRRLPPTSPPRRWITVSP